MLQIAIDKIQSCDNIETARSIANSVNSNQVLNKLWLVNQLQPYIDMYKEKPKVCVAAGWHGLAAHMIGNAVSFDMDPMCKEVKLFSNVTYQTSTIEDFDPTPYDIIICTSCEHITDDVINGFISKKRKDSVVVLQSNDYYYITDHINCKVNSSDFANKIDMKVLEEHTLPLEKYNRFMLIGL